MRTIPATLLALLFLSNVSSAGEAPANSEVALVDSFERTELGSGWNANAGNWRIVDGVLRGSEIAADKHAAAARRVVETKDAVYQLKFRLTDSAKAFHFGFDPARGELQKKGHLFSVVITPHSWQLLKHADKNHPKADPNETLAEQKTNFTLGEWYSLRVTTWGPYVTARVEGKDSLKASHPTFGVKKPTLVFRCVGDGVEIDDIQVWTPRQK